MSDSLEQFFELETLLVDRLKEKAAEGVKTLTAADLAGVELNQQHTPSYHVIYGGYRIVDSAAGGSKQLIEQRWFVVTATRNARTQISGTAGRQEAGVLFTTALRALLGWLPGPGYTRLALGTGGSPSFKAGGYSYYPLVVTSRFTVTGETTRSPR